MKAGVFCWINHSDHKLLLSHGLIQAFSVKLVQWIVISLSIIYNSSKWKANWWLWENSNYVESQKTQSLYFGHIYFNQYLNGEIFQNAFQTKQTNKYLNELYQAQCIFQNPWLSHTISQFSASGRMWNNSFCTRTGKKILSFSRTVQLYFILKEPYINGKLLPTPNILSVWLCPLW